jgi:signal transduction histidine kinase/CheY-like chemotaxis protein
VKSPQDVAHQEAQWLLAGAHELLWLVDGQTLCVLQASASVEQALGYPLAQLRGMALADLECALGDIFFWDEMAGRATAVAEGAYRCADGRVLVVQKRVLRVAEQPLRYVVSATPSAHANQVAQEREMLAQRLSATLEATEDGILLVDQTGTILNMNRRFAQFWRVPEALLLAHDDAGISAHVDAQTARATTHKDMRQSTNPGQGADYFQTRTLVDGRVVDVSSHLAYAGEQLIGRVYSYRDVTQLYRVQDELIAARDEAKQANLAKSRFLATMSHEIRTPMNGILGMAQLLMQPGLSASQRHDYVQTVLHSGQSLLTLLNDILDLSKIEAGKFQIDPAPFAIEALLFEVQTLFDGAAKNKQLRVNAQWLGRAGAVYRSDAHRLRQMLSNLLGNAIKFSNQGHIEVTARERECRGESVVLEFAVQDHGIGIAADKLCKLFQPFSQADSSTTREYGGSGLGLSIVHSLAELMGGQVGVQSTPGQGSRFWFSVVADAELAPAQQPGDAALAAPEPVPPGRTLRGLVLVAEDNPVNCLVIEGLLTQLGLRVELTHDGAQALARVQAGLRPGLVLMDLNMPVMDGTTASRAIRQWEAEQGQPMVPIIALTADAFEEDRLRCLQAGMDDFLTKPVALADLQRALSRWLA